MLKNFPKIKLYAARLLQIAKAIGLISQGNVLTVQSMTQTTSQSNAPAIQSTAQTTDFPSLDLATDFTSALVDAQYKQADSLDTKANFILGAATGLISAALVLLPSLLASNKLLDPHSNCSVFVPVFLYTLSPLLKKAIPLLPLLITYLIVMALAYQAYRTRDFTLVPNPRRLLDKYLEKPVYYTKAVVFQGLVEAFEENGNAIIKKANYIRFAFSVLIIESLALVLLLLLQALC